MDQALGLRRKQDQQDPWESSSTQPLSSRNHSIRVMTVSSGKGGVGKSNIVVNLALAFDRMGKKVLILDADLGLANIDLLLGLTPKFNVSHVLSGAKKFREVLVQGPGNIRIMPASSGVQQLTQLTDEQKLLFLQMLEDVEAEIDVLLIDTAAGISDTVLYFNLAAQERIIVVTPEPTSLTDAYALIKVLFVRHGERYFKVLANAVESERAGKVIFGNISKVAEHFLDGLSLDYLGSVPYDPNIPKAVLHQSPFLGLFPESPASRAIAYVAGRIEKTCPHVNHGSIQFFWKRLLNI
jgi:flagellar biosynthesis protein FlhG